MSIHALEQTYNESYWDERVRHIDRAWHWKQAKYWVGDYIRQENVPALTIRARQIDDEINNVIAELAELRAWSFCFSRLTENHRRHMQSWQQSMQRLGQGTGKYASRHRRDAQEHLNECRAAVPAWVMPLHRVWDTVYPSPGIFDVIIVDEASQCGVEAFPLLYLGKKVLIVGDDKQISPEDVGIDNSQVHRLMDEFLIDFRFKSSFDLKSTLFDYGKQRYSMRQITLREHFRCMPEIIRFSNALCYDNQLIPLRQYGSDRLSPLKHVFVPDGYRKGDGNKVINSPEAKAIVTKIVELCVDRRYDGKTMGVIVLQGEAQAALIEAELLKKISTEEMEKRRLVCGNSYSFQGDERDIIFLSLVTAPDEHDKFREGRTDEKRYNVAMSRARDQVWLFHSVASNQLSKDYHRKGLLEHFENPISQTIAGIDREELARLARQQQDRRIVKAPKPFDSWFEVDVALELLSKDFSVIPQYEVSNKRIDLVVEGGQSRLAIECDGDYWHGPDRYEEDMLRQRQLERCGWEFFRVRESLFYANKEELLTELWITLENRGILPYSQSADLDEKSDLVESEETECEFDSDVLEEDEENTLDDKEPHEQDNAEIIDTRRRRSDDIANKEIENTILIVLSNCPNYSCTLNSIAKRVLKEIGVITRGEPLKKFEKRTMKCVDKLESQDRIEKYTAKNQRLRLKVNSINGSVFAFEDNH